MDQANPEAVDDPAFPGGESRGCSGRSLRGSVGWTSAVMAVAVALLLLFNAQSPRSWTATQAPSPLALAARDVAESWWRTTSRLGLAAPRTAISRLWETAQAARWPPSGRRAAPMQACGARQRLRRASSAKAQGSTGPAAPACDDSPAQR